MRLSWYRLALAPLAAAGLLLGCGTEDVGIESKSVEELRSEITLRDFSDALQDEDWKKACGRMTPEAVRQLVSLTGYRAAQAVGKEDVICEPLVKALFVGADIPDVRPAEDGVEPRDADVVVRTNAGSFRLSKDALDIEHFPPPQR
jgi:hypothetical protein